MNSDITRIRIPNFSSPDSGVQGNPIEQLVEANTNRIEIVQQAIADTDSASQPTGQRLESSPPKPNKIDGLIDSILAKFPLSHPITLSFVGCKTDTETDAVAADVAQRLAERRVGKVLLVDANPNSQSLSNNLGLAGIDGLGNVICDDQPWKSLLQAGPTDGIDVLPFGNVNTAKTLRSKTQNFLADAKPEYQFICVSAGLNDRPISKSFSNVADGIYLIVDLVNLSHPEAKAAADQILLKNLPLVGCIALDAEQDQQ